MKTYCPRCKTDVEAEYRHDRRWRAVCRAYLFVWIPLVPLYPMIASEYTVCIPLLMVYLSGFGPVLHILHDPAACPDCDANLNLTTPAPADRGRL